MKMTAMLRYAFRRTWPPLLWTIAGLLLFTVVLPVGLTVITGQPPKVEIVDLPSVLGPFSWLIGGMLTWRWLGFFLRLGTDRRTGAVGMLTILTGTIVVFVGTLILYQGLLTFLPFVNTGGPSFWTTYGPALPNPVVTSGFYVLLRVLSPLTITLAVAALYAIMRALPWRVRDVMAVIVFPLLFLYFVWANSATDASGNHGQHLSNFFLGLHARGLNNPWVPLLLYTAACIILAGIFYVAVQHLQLPRDYRR